MPITSVLSLYILNINIKYICIFGSSFPPLSSFGFFPPFFWTFFHLKILFSFFLFSFCLAFSSFKIFFRFFILFIFSSFWGGGLPRNFLRGANPRKAPPTDANRELQ